MIGGGGEGELPIHQGDAAMPELAQAADGLHPAEDLFHEFSFPLTHVLARMPRGPTVDRTPADLLRHVGRDVLDAHVGNEARHIVALVAPTVLPGEALASSNSTRRVAFGGPRRVGRADVGDKPEESQSQRLCRAVRQVDQRGVSHTRGPARRGASASSRLRVHRTLPSREKPPGTRQPAPATTTTSAKAGRRRSAAGTLGGLLSFYNREAA